MKYGTVLALGMLLAGQAAAQSPAPVAPQASPPTLETVEPLAGEGILGKSVWGAGGENMGLVTDVIVDQGGVPQAAVIDFGGFLGVGSRKIAVDWSLLQFQPGNDKMPVKLSLNPAALKSAPEYKPSDQSIKIVGPPPDMK
jgi:hypothetical protein